MSVWLATGAAGGFLGVALGAFGAHALKESLGPKGIELWQTAVLYQFVHSLALLAIGLWQRIAAPAPAPGLHAAGWCFAAGIALFSGSLYLLALTGLRKFGAVTPLGGLAFLAGWLLLVRAAMR